MTSAPRAIRAAARALRRLESRHRAWRYRVLVDPAEVAWVRGSLTRGDVAVDAGAYKGGYTYWMRASVGRPGSVLAFEPQPELAAFLNGRVNDFGWDNVDVHPIGLGAEPARATLHVPGEGPSQRGSLVVARPGATRYSVPIERLDDVLGRSGLDGRVSLIKCDVEGHELDMLRGARRTLVTDRPRLLIEHEARFCRKGARGQVFDFLRSLGYRGSFFWKGRRRPLSEFDFTTHQVEGRKPYANNFAFEPF